MESIYKQLEVVQKTLKAPKGQFNAFAKYRYRSCEDILEAIKPLLKDMVLTISDELVNIGDRYYIKATACLSNGEKSLCVNGYAREEESKKGMDGSQITGAASSYARKYALNGLFLIDDSKDSDHTNVGKGEPETDRALNIAELTQITNYLDNYGVDQVKFLKYVSSITKTEINGVEGIPASKFDMLIKMLKQKATQKTKGGK